VTEKISKYDTADYLKTREDIVLYLDACMDEDPGDGQLIRNALGTIARTCDMNLLSKDTGIPSEDLSRAFSLEGNPEFSTVMKIIRAFGMKLHAVSIDAPYP